MKRRELSAALLLATGVTLTSKDAAAQSCTAPCYPLDSTESGLPITINSSYPRGNVLRYGADPTGSVNSSDAFKHALACNSEIFVPDGRYSVGKISVAAAGKIIRGQSRYNAILFPDVSLLAGEPLIYNANRASGTGTGYLIENLHFQLYRGTANVDCIGVDLGSINNAVIRCCRFKGYNKSGAKADGVVFDAPLSGGAYSNSIVDCDFSDLENGVRFGSGANNNYIFGGEFVSCVTGVNAAPAAGTLDTPKLFGPRIEGCDTGLKERAHQGMYFGLRFEANSVDVDFLQGSVEPHFFGGHTASSAICFKNPSNASGLTCLAPDLQGAHFRSNSASRAHEFVGPNVFAPLGDVGTVANPAGAGTTAAYFRGGRVVLDNSQWIVSRDAAGTGIVYAIEVNSSNILEVGASGKVDIGNTSASDRTRVFKPSFLFTGAAATGSIVTKFPVYAANGSLVGYVPVYSG